MNPISQKVVHILLILVVTHSVSSRPSSEYPQLPEYGGKCSRSGNEHAIEVCQRCAKQTKSNIVYPMCCLDQEDVFNWCERYINYGKQAKRSTRTT